LSTRAASTIAATPDSLAPPRDLLASLGGARARAALAVGGVAVSIGAGLFVASSDHLVDAGWYGAQIAVVIIGAVAAALYWLAHRPGNRIAVLLLAYAVAASGLALQGASDPFLHSVGVLCDAPMFLLGWWLVFAFPQGTLGGLLERLLVGAVAVALLTSFVPWFFFSPVVSGGAPLAGCNAACPENALMIADRPPIASGLGTTEEYYSVFVGSAIALGLLALFLRAAKPRRRGLLPVYVPAFLLIVPFVLFHAAGLGLIDLEAQTYNTIGWLLTAGRTTLSLGFLVAIAQTAIFAGIALRTIMSRVGHGHDAAHLRTLVGDALDDPQLELAVEIDEDGSFVGSRGETVDVEGPPGGRAVTAFHHEGHVAGYIVHDEALSTDPELLQAAGQAVVLSLESGRLETELQSKIEALQRSRDRIVSAGETERRRIERDLHDGAQQRLMAIQVKLAMAAERTPDDDLAEQLEAIRLDVADAVDELRTLSHGIYPSVLLERGVGDALRSVAMTTPLGIRVTDEGLGRCPAAIEAAIYFCALEAIQNTIKHAGPGARVAVVLRRGSGTVEFAISDDGVGMDDGARSDGVGLVSMQDRIGAVGGDLEIASVPGRGTTVRGTVPEPVSRATTTLGAGV
jgi:signal transduction histidine kinase